MKKRKIILAIFVFIIIEAISFTSIQHLYKKETSNYLAEKSEEVKVKQSAVRGAYTIMIESFLKQIISQPNVLELFSEAQFADSIQKNEIRNNLYNLLLPTYENLRLSNIRQFIFILPNNEVFIRFHRPENYGDNLSDIRYSVKMANSTKQILTGFEEGRTYNGFRNIFPITYNNKHIGLIEISFSFNIKTLFEASGDTYAFMIKKDIVNNKLFESERDNYIPSLLSDEYLLEKAFSHYTNDTLSILKQIDKNIKSEIADKLSENKNFTIHHNINNIDYLISFILTKNIEGNSAAYIISYHKDKNIISGYQQQNIVRHISISILILIIVFVILFISLKKGQIINIPSEYKDILDANTDIVYMINYEGKILYCNKQIEKFLGYKIDEVVGKMAFSYFSKNENFQSKYIDLFKKGRIISFELLALHKNGSQIPVEVAAKIINFKDQKVAVGTIRDITKRKKAELALKKSEAELRESNATKDKFFSIIAHDLKSPFNVILGFSEILLENHKNYDNIKREQIISLVNKSANSAFNLVENLLTWSRSQSGNVSYLPEEVHLKILLFETINILQTQADKKHISISDKSSENDVILADRNMIATVFRNLISNAIKFTHKNGSVVITSKIKQESNYIEISVKDSGVGIPKDKIDDLFRIDKDVSAKGTENESGTGLGLILCKEFVEKHGGEIWVESEVGKGSSFHLTLPINSGYEIGKLE
jgi:two-component system, sensor histidine kinase and response regulator